MNFDFSLKPKNLFLLDGIGAFLSAFLLAVVLVRLDHIIGMPPMALYILALFPVIFLIYDFCCYFWVKEKWVPYIKMIAIANLLYCMISISAVIYHYQKLTQLGITYFLLEVVVIIFLVRIELKTATSLRSA